MWDLPLLQGQLQALRCSGLSRELKCIPDPSAWLLLPRMFGRPGAVGSCGQEKSDQCPITEWDQPLHQTRTKP